MRLCRLHVVFIFAALPVALAAQGPADGRGRGGPGRGRPLFDDLHGAVIAGAPFTGVRSTNFQQTLANGNHIVRQSHATVYRDGAGRLRIERTLARGAGATETPVVTIVDPVAGFAFTLDPTTMTGTQMRFRRGPGRLPGGHGDAGSPRAQQQDLGTKTVGGVSASGIRTTETIPAGAFGNEQPIVIVRESWYSNDLKMPVVVSVADPRGGDSVMQFSHVVLGEPDSTLFQVPAGYTVSVHQGPPDRPGRGR